LVRDTVGHNAVAGVEVQLQEAVVFGVQPWTASARTGSDGQFTLDNVPSGTIFAVLQKPGFLARETGIGVSQSGSVTIDMIADLAPFSLDFYRQFARNGFEQPAKLSELRRWSVSPKFLIQTVTADTGVVVSPAIVTAAARVITNSVPELTGGLYHAEIVTSAIAPAQTTGWFYVRFYSDASVFANGLDGSLTKADSSVGGDAGLIRLLYAPDLDQQGLYNPQHCESLTIDALDHEIVHAMGFYHTSHTASDFHSGVGCPGNGRPDIVRFHAMLAYQRPHGNQDIDSEKSAFYTVGQ